MRIIIALGFFSQWSGNGLFSYYLNEIFQVRDYVSERGYGIADAGLQTLGITSPGMKTLLNGVLQIWNLIMALGGAMFVDRLGRRTLFVSDREQTSYMTCLANDILGCIKRRHAMWYVTLVAETALLS